MQDSVNSPSSEPSGSEEELSFAQLMAQMSADPAPMATAGPQPGDRLEGRIVNFTADAALVDVGGKSEGFIPLEQLRSPEGELTLQPGDSVPVIVEKIDPEGNLRLGLLSADRPRNLEDLRLAFEEQRIVIGKVGGLGKGGLHVNVGLRAFMPQSRSGARSQEELHALVGQEIRARIARFDAARENIVLDRRVVLEEERAAQEADALQRLHEGDAVEATVKSLTTYGAFVDLGGIEALLHVGDMSWQRIENPGTLLAIGDRAQVKILKIEAQKRRISVGIKQLTPDPWLSAADKYAAGQRVRGTVKRLAEFGAFVEIEPGIEGLIHVSEMSWSRRAAKPKVLTPVGSLVEAVVLEVNVKDRKIALGLKQALGDPWDEAAKKFAPQTIVEGRVRNLQPFGAFVELAEGVDGMIHIGDISDQRLQHPSEALKVGETVRVQVLELDLPKRRLRLGLKQLAPKPIDLWIAAHQPGEVVSGRVVKAYPARVQLDEGVEAACPAAGPPVRKIEEGTLAAKLAAVWQKPQAAEAAPEPPRVTLKAGEMRNFRLLLLDAENKKIEVEPA